MNAFLTRGLFLLLLCCAVPRPAIATHIVGGEMTYQYLGDTIISSELKKKYQVCLTIFQDCKDGDDDAILKDNPAYIGVFNAAGNAVQVDTNVYFTTQERVPPNFENSCVTPAPAVCVQRTVFYKMYYLAPNVAGYTIAYQRCCRNGSIANILNPGNTGATFFCSIPPSAYANNSSPVFSKFPPLIICANNPLVHDHSAMDADGDSLVYSFCNSLTADGTNDKQLPAPPPYENVGYISPYSGASPIRGVPPIQIDKQTGLITGIPGNYGRYLVTVCCDEYRAGVLIGTTKREFQFVITNCSRAVVADVPGLPDKPDTYIIDCEDLTVHFVNQSKGGKSYQWSFGDGGVSNDREPTHTYPDTGTYIVKLLVNPHSTCADSISKLVKVYPKFRAGFEYSGSLCPGLPVSFIDISSSTTKPSSFWQWRFGDGTTGEGSLVRHSFAFGGTFNIVFVAGNELGCRDTAIKQLVVQQFHPNAGRDTMIVKGEHINFHANGGINYLWKPAAHLSDTTIPDPRGYYPDTGLYTYVLYVESAYGCRGYDTIHISVLNNGYFVVPNAFSPDRDGLNDVFRPLSVGYSDLKYFRVFNRFGQEVYFSETLETGWDGTFKGIDAELGVYYWVIRYVDRTGAEGMMKGDVTLLR